SGRRRPAWSLPFVPPRLLGTSAPGDDSVVRTWLGLAACMLAVVGIACSQPPSRPHPVGLAFRAYTDPLRRDWAGTNERPLATAVWYPAVPAAHEQEWRVGPFAAGWSAVDAAPAEDPATLPLIVLSHGTGGGAAMLSWLAEALASNGYLVAAVNHHGNTAI